MRWVALLALLAGIAAGCAGGVSEQTSREQKDLEDNVNAKQEIPPGEGPAY